MTNLTTRPTTRHNALWSLVLVLALWPIRPVQGADSDVVINEIMYHPDTDCEGEEFIELHNRNTSDSVNLSGWRFSDGIAYTFSPGTILGPGQYLVVTGDIAAFNDYYGTPSITLLGPWTGQLSNDGEPIELVNASSTLIDRVRYNDKRPWPISPDGAGPSLELINPFDDNTSAGLWRGAIANSFTTTWTHYEVSGIATSTTVYLYLDSAGECLIDDVELWATTNPVTNLISNGGFETTAPLQWTATGSHSGSLRVATDAFTGSACMKMVATSSGGAYSGQVWQTCQPLELNGPTYTLSFWAKGLQPGVILRAGLRGAGGGTWTPTTSQDIGAVGASGGFSYDAPTSAYTVWGSGADIWGSTDEFHYLYTTLNGDGALEATVSWVGIPPDLWAKTGIMFRETNAPTSLYIFALVRRDYGLYLQWRTSGTAAGPTPGSPVRIRLTRQGNTFTAEYDSGGGFVPYSTQNYPMNSTCLVGFAVTSHLDGQLATARFAQPLADVGSGFFTEISVPGFFATPGARNSRYSTNVPPYIRNVDTAPDQPNSAQPVQVRAKVTDDDGITSVVLRYQVVPPGSYIRIGDPQYQTNWTTVDMIQASTPTYYVTTIGPFAHRTLLRYRISARDGTGQEETVPYSDDSEPNYARFVYNGVPPYVAARQPGSTPLTTHTVLTKVPVLHLLAQAADVNEAQTVTISDKVERRQFKWYATVVFNGNVYDHIRFRMRGGTWRYRYQKRMWKFRFNRGHYLEFVQNDGRLYEEELQTLNLLACIQTPHVPTWVRDTYGVNTQRGEAGIIERACFWLWQQVGAIAPDATWIHYRIVDNPSEAGVDPNPAPPDESQYYGDFFGLYLATQGMDERMLRMNNRPVGNFYKIDSFGQVPGEPPWDQDAMNCAQPVDDIVEFRRQYGPAPGYPTPTRQWWEDNFDLDSYYSCRAIIDCVHHGDIYPTTPSFPWPLDGVETGKNYYYYHNPGTNKWEFVAWDVDLTFGTDHGAGNSPFRDRVVRNGSFPEFQIAYRNRLREVVQLLFNEEKFFPKMDEWRDLLIEIATADMYRWDWAPLTAPSDVHPNWGSTGQWGIFQPLDTRLGDLKYWIVERNRWLATPPTVNWWLERSTSTWPHATCWDANIPSTPTLTAPTPGVLVGPTQPITLTSSAYSDPNGSPHAASKWIATRVGGNELMPNWTSGITTTSLTSTSIPGWTLPPGDYWLRVRHMDNTGRWSWWSPLINTTVTSGALEVRHWPEY